MNRDEFFAIVEDEKLLGSGCLYKGIDDPCVSGVYGCMFEDGKWIPYETDERACVMMHGEYDSESEALEGLLKTLRRNDRIRRSKLAEGKS